MSAHQARAVYGASRKRTSSTPRRPRPMDRREEPKEERSAAAPVAAVDERRVEAPPRPRTPCMNRDVRKKRISSAGRPRPANSVGVRMFQLESRLLGRDERPARPASSGSRAHGGTVAPSSKLIQEAMEMCRQSKAATVSLSARQDAVCESPPPDQLQRPPAPTPEQTNHWLQGMEEKAQASPSPRGRRPRSPTPTKMLAWGEEDTPSAGCSSRALYFSPSDDDRENHSDGLINRLIEACQMDDVKRALNIYERLRRLNVPLYEGVYKLIIECCMRTQQLGHGIQFYETLKGSGQRVSSRIVIMLVEACAREQQSEKVQALWEDWCPPDEPLRPCDREVLMVTLGALVRTLCPDLALELLVKALPRCESSWVLHVEAEVQELLHLVDFAASEAHGDGHQLGQRLLSSCRQLQHLLLKLLEESKSTRFRRKPSSEAQFESEGATCEELLMEDVDLDLELAAM